VCSFFQGGSRADETDALDERVRPNRCALDEPTLIRANTRPGDRATARHDAAGKDDATRASDATENSDPGTVCSGRNNTRHKNTGAGSEHDREPAGNGLGSERAGRFAPARWRGAAQHQCTGRTEEHDDTLCSRHGPAGDSSAGDTRIASSTSDDGGAGAPDG
jgi:hypothetical protein